jgi:predicted ATPase
LGRRIVSVVEVASFGLHERDAELAAVEAEWQAARAGSGRLVIVEGAAGIG